MHVQVLHRLRAVAAAVADDAETALGHAFQAGDLARLRRCRIDGRALLRGVVRARMQLGSNVSWPNALESLYFELSQS